MSDFYSYDIAKWTGSTWLHLEGAQALEVRNEAGEVIARAPRPSAQEWCTEPPTEPGWYWGFDKRELEPVIVHAIYLAHDHNFLTFICDWDNRDDFDFTHWLGPLTPPDPPT